MSYKRCGKSFTGDAYFKLPYGPIPSLIKEHLDLLKQENDENQELKDFELKSVFAEYLEAKKDTETNGHRLEIREGVEIPRKFNDYFSENDNDLFSAIVEVFKGKGVREVVEMTHQEVPYTRVKRDVGVISYLSALDKTFPKALPNYHADWYSV